MRMDDERAVCDLLLQQICDSVFPIGAYSHSWGLETYIQRGDIADVESAWGFVRAQVAYPLTYTEMLGMRLAYEAARAVVCDCEGAAPGPNAWHAVVELERELAALRTPAETRGASAKLAARFIRTVGALGGLDERSSELFDAYAASARTHAANVAYGVFSALAGIELEALLRRYLYSQVSAMTVNCVKSIPLSQTAGQRILSRSRELQVQAVRRALAAEREELGLSMPGFDARCIEHEGIYSRLYMS